MDRKIYSISDCSAEGDDHYAEDEIETMTDQDENSGFDDQWHESDAGYDVDYADDSNTSSQDTASLVTMLLCAALALLWTGAFLYTNRDLWSNGVTVQEVTTMLSGWSGPIVILLIIFFLISRRRRAEAKYYEQQVLGIAQASDMLDERLRATNNELSMAREFLGNQSTQLDSLGRTATKRLTERAEEIRDMIDGSDKSMQSIADVGNAAKTNLETLREHMPVVINSAKDMTNQIGNAGRMAQGHIRDMIAGFQKINEFGEASNTQIDVLNKTIFNAFSQWEAHIKEIERSAHNSAQYLVSNSENAAKLLDERQQSSLAGLEQFSGNFKAQLDGASTAMQRNLDQFDTTITALIQQREAESEAMSTMLDGMAARLESIRSDMANMDEDASQRTANIAFAINALNSEVSGFSETLAQSHAATEALTRNSEELSTRAAALSSELGEGLEGKVSTIAETLERSEKHGKKSLKELEKMIAHGQQLEKLLEFNALSLTDQEQHIERFNSNFSGFIGQNKDALENADALLSSLNSQMDSVSTDGQAKLTAVFSDIRDNAEQSLSEIEKRLNDVTDALASTMGERSEEVLANAMRNKSEETIGRLQLALNQALGATREASVSLTEQIGKVDELTANLEARVEQARERAELQLDQRFTANMEAITESLNSASIDINEALYSQVSDTAWAEYLKGDRGIFTRQAVSLLSSGEESDIAEHYQRETEFQNVVNRYIHDFEAMLRDILSHRNGEAMGITLLSSDIGKLYVALAQAIERLR